MTQQQINTLVVTDPPSGGIGDTVVNVSAGQGTAAFSFPPTALSAQPASTFNFNPASANLSDGAPFYIVSTFAVPAPLAPYTKYYVVNATPSSFQVSATYGGSPIALTNIGSGTLSIYTGFAALPGSPWDTVLDTFDMAALDSANVVPALDAAPTASGSNPLVTVSLMDTAIEERKGFLLVGPAGSGADFEGDDETPFNAAFAFLGGPGRVYAKPGTYTFSSTLNIPSDVHVVGSPGTVLASSGNFPAVSLAGTKSSLDYVSVQAPNLTTSCAVRVLGSSNLVTRTDVTAFSFCGVQLGGSGNQLAYCRLSSTASLASQAVIVQGTQNNVNWTTFEGTLPGGAVLVEGAACGVFGCYFASSLTGYSYLILSSSVEDTRVVANHFQSPTSLAASNDYGTGSVRYGNTPNTLQLNQNNFLLPLAEYTGQPLIESSSVTLDPPANSPLAFPFAVSANDVTSVLDEEDLLVRRAFEERNWFLTSGAVTYDALGNAVAGTFSWDGVTLTYPTFYVRSPLNRGDDPSPSYPDTGRWVIQAGSTALSPGQALYVTIDQNLATSDITLTPLVTSAPLPLAASNDTQYLVLAYCLGGGRLVWLSSNRVLGAQTEYNCLGAGFAITVNMATNASTAAAEKFTAASGSVQFVNVTLSSSGTPTGSLVAKVYDSTGAGGSPGTVLGTSDSLELSLLTSVASPFTFLFSPGVALTPGQTYFFSVEFAPGASCVSPNAVGVRATSTSANLKTGAPAGAWVHTTSWSSFGGINVVGSAGSDGGALFDVDGTPLPIVRYIGSSEEKNPPLPPSMFGGASLANLTDKLSAHSGLLRSLYERTNTTFEPASADAEFVTDPTPGPWLTSAQLTTGLPAGSTPTHVIQSRTTAWGILNGSGSSLVVAGRTTTPVQTPYSVGQAPNTPSYVGLTFVAAASGSVTGVSAWIENFQSAGTLTAYIRGGALPSTPAANLATSNTFNTSSSPFYPSPGVRVDFTFSSPATVTAGDTYSVIFQGTDPSFIVLFGYTGTTQSIFTSTDGSSWSPGTTGDIYYEVTASQHVAGLYRYRYSTKSWTQIPGCPLSGPFTALAPVQAGLALLQTDGKIAYFDPDVMSWSAYTPSLTGSASAAVTDTSRSATFPVGGQVDYSLQTKSHSYFKTLSGAVARFSLAGNTLDVVPYVYTEDAGSSGLLSSSMKDTGFNTLRDPDTQWESLDNGLSYTASLPGGTRSKLLAADDGAYGEFYGTDFSALLFENFSHDLSSGAWISVYRDQASSNWYVLGGGSGGVSYLYSILPSTSPYLSDFTPMHWAVNAQRQEAFALGATASDARFAVLRGVWSTSGWAWTKQVLGPPNSCQGCVAVYDAYPGGSNQGDLFVFVSSPSVPPTVFKWTASTASWNAGTPLGLPAVAFSYVYGSAPLAAFGAASPLGVGFLFSDGTRSGQPTLAFFDRASQSYTIQTLALASAAQFYGAAYHAQTQSVYYVARSAAATSPGTTTLYAQHQGGLRTSVWTSVTLGTGAALGQSFTARSGTQLAVDNTVPVSATPVSAYLLSNDGISTITLSGSAAGFTGASVTSYAQDTIGDYYRGVAGVGMPGFSSCCISPYLPQVGSCRGGEPSVAVGSWVGARAPQVAGFGYDPGLGAGLFWTSPGTGVKCLGANLWAGINRGGYLWIANAATSPLQVELTPNPSALRGTVTVPSLGALASDFDFDVNPSNGQVGFVFADGGNSNRLAFLLWDPASGAVTYERGNIAPFNPTGASNACQSPPRIAFNPVASSWDIVVTQNRPGGPGGQVSFFRRPATGTAWTSELLGPLGDGTATKVLTTMTASAGLNPAKPHVEANGDVVVATQVGASGDLLVFYRQAASNSWLTASGPLGASGFVSPELAVAGSKYWVFGNPSGATASVASSASHTSGFSLFANPYPAAYARVTAVKAFAYPDGVAVASPLSAITGAASGQEMGVFFFANSGSVYPTSFAAMGRAQSFFYSGEEESMYANHSWTYTGALLYGATRPGRVNPHYSVRVSRTGWKWMGDSCLGSGRLHTLGSYTYREEYVDDPNLTSLIHQFDVSHAHVASWTALPVAERDVGNFTAMRYPNAADPSSSPLFVTGNSSGVVADASLPSGTLPAASARSFPLLGGETRIQGGKGAGVLYNGAMASVSAPYLPVVGASGLLKLTAVNTLTMKGSFIVKVPNDPSRTYALTGPLSFTLPDAETLGTGVGGPHLVLQFPQAATLQLDSAANPLSYWTDLHYPTSSITLVLGELRERCFALYPVARMNSRLVRLAYGTLELPDIEEDVASLSYCAPVSQYCISKIINQKFDVQPAAIDSVTVQRVGSLEGFQVLQFAAVNGSYHLVVAGGLPPHSTGYYIYAAAGETVAGEGQMRIEHVAGRYSNLVVFS